ncbi:conserved hypothetical protein [Methylocella silvestris BL2]|uniref:DUF4440 domain-containing protein n=1 Tax=Methylocella silvestris (strain DSM 15510 / CIP 108128 / LMG 27833 / NCIMB 13906 / BL2) TaxID=395965 RepID=B8EM92_METSB|nr:SgcJ/EcaC family oxidoreductase [Methylocella silvestris]ACK51481.1 conserved hypothetical protein [Methylocella silvestris BL2]
MHEDERQIRDLVESWFSASKSGDFVKILDLIAEDAIFSVTGQPPFGKNAFAAGLQFLRGVAVDGSYEIAEIKVLGDWAFMRNAVRVTMTPPGGAEKRMRGHTLTILRKDEGRWRVARDSNVMGEI